MATGWARAFGLLGLFGAACGDPEALPCEEPPGAAPELDRVTLAIGDAEVSAEVALREDERRSAWAGRRCDLDALLWVPDAVGAVAIELCEVEVAVDLAFLHRGEVIAVELERPPCEAPCDACPTYGEGAPTVDAVLWFPAGQVDVAVGDSVTGLDEVALPTG